MIFGILSDSILSAVTVANRGLLCGQEAGRLFFVNIDLVS